MMFLTKIRERQFAKKWGGAYNLSRAVLAGVLAAGCLMPRFAEAAPEPPKLVTINEFNERIDVGHTPVGKTATITGTISGSGFSHLYIYWKPGDGEDSVEGCTLNVNAFSSPNIRTDIYGGSGETAKGNSVIISGSTIDGSVYGGSGTTAYGNSVDISDSNFTGQIYGGFSYDGTADENRVIISGGEFTGQIYGGLAFSNSGEANKNIVSISGGNINSNVYGGYSVGTATGNRVIISGGNITGLVSGGYSVGTATGNRVSISGGTIRSVVSGGYSDSDGANYNKVIISGDTINSYVNLVYGGYGKTAADGNSVIISGGTVNNIVGGFATTSYGTAKDNKVILVGENASYHLSTGQTLTGGTIEIRGDVFGGSGTSNRSGNAIHVYGSNTKVGNIANFDNLYFYINNKMTYGDVMLKITDNDVTNISASKVIVNVAPKAKGDLNTITLIQKTDASRSATIEAPNNDNITVNFGPVLTGTGSVALVNDKNLVLTLKNITVNENGKSLVETRAAAAFVVNNMSDFMLGTGMEQAKAAAGSVTPIDAGTMAPFAAVGGSNMRYTTGSYVDVNGWNGAVGFAKQADKLLFGVAVEHGRGNYDSYLDNGVHASGDIKSTGGVIFGEYKLDNGVHYDAALRAGRVKSDYSSTATSYDESSAYYGFSLGGGKELTVSDKATVDVYGRYYFSHTNGSDVSIATGEEIDFDAVNSHRLRIGGRYTTTLTEKAKAYAGLAWQYEFGGDAKAAINGYSAPTPSLQGHSAIVEAGYKLNAGKNLTLDFNLNGTMGKQRGIGGGIGAQWLF